MADRTHSSLLSLPAELRLMIFEFLWASLSHTINHATHFIHQSSLPSSLDLSILLTCRQIHAEAQKTAFRNHTFAIFNVIPNALLEHISLHSPFNLITSLLIPIYNRESSLIKSVSMNDPSHIRYIRLIQFLRHFVRLLPALQIIYCATTTELARRGLLSRSLRARARFRRRMQQRDHKAGRYVTWKLKREEGGEVEGDLGRWEMKVWMWGEGDQEERQWKVVSLVMCALNGMEDKEKASREGMMAMEVEMQQA